MHLSTVILVAGCCLLAISTPWSALSIHLTHYLLLLPLSRFNSPVPPFPGSPPGPHLPSHRVPVSSLAPTSLPFGLSSAPPLSPPPGFSSPGPIFPSFGLS